MQRITLLRQFWLVPYWLVFVGISVWAGRSPGYVRHPELAPYPVFGVVSVSAFLGICCAVLHFVLRPRTFSKPWKRLLVAFCLTMVLTLVTLSTAATDLPGIAYVPLLFALITTLGLFSTMLGLAIRSVSSGKGVEL